MPPRKCHRLWTHRAACVAVILRTKVLARGDDREQVLRQDGCLRGDGRSGLARRQARAVAKRPDVAILRVGMPQRAVVDAHPARLVRKRRVLDDVKRTHWRGDVQERVVHVDGRPIALLERRFVVSRVDRDEVVREGPADAPLDAQLFQRVGVLLHAEHCWGACVEVDRDLVSAPGRPEAVPSHPHDLLGS